MRLESYRSAELARGLAARIAALARRLGRPISLMEVCGTHTLAIARHGLRSCLPESVRLLSGPGCPVCVTPQRDIDRAIAIARSRHVQIITFGDLFRVPGSQGSLEQARAAGARVRIAYSPMDALAAARAEPECETVFLGIGFETTAPALAAALRRARADGLSNLSLLPMGKLVPPALRAILADGRARVDGLLLPGHVSAILGVAPYEFIPREFRVPCVITGFEPVDILDGIRGLLEQTVEGRAEVEIGYRRAVSPQGNPTARALMAEVFTPCDAEWRALGVIPASGLALSPAYASADAARKFPVEVPEAAGDPGCLCGEILTGRAQPRDCPLFGKSCTPDEPVGPCMVSSEGTCAAHFKYGES